MGEGRSRRSFSGRGGTEPGVRVRMLGALQGWGAGSPGLAWREQVWGSTWVATLHPTVIICSAWFAGSRCGTCTGWCRLRGSRAGHSAPCPRTRGPGAVLRTLGVPRSLPVGETNRDSYGQVTGTMAWTGREEPGLRPWRQLRRHCPWVGSSPPLIIGSEGLTEPLFSPSPHVRETEQGLQASTHSDDNDSGDHSAVRTLL